ncbi:tripartite tricarboxylate transporter substrate binding protein [Variovorax paradoxus]|uniref:tripartite tricarboxylate transporter substrate binding protein n=1 Tax=Variovorax paradoxus TaxID=34073 RepID=UPI0021AC211B|nr:tripartite tricarboxylate transporter substrate binding protein [Variovorax paradoxus]UVH55127.1 tripartite tricarboxylate transporter substrate binding protein [Variovorax paradoxus]
MPKEFNMFFQLREGRKAAGVTRRLERLIGKLVWLNTLLGVLCMTGTAYAQYPTRPISIIVPFAAGGTTDILARKVAEVLRSAGGQAVIVDNKPGAGGTIASRFVAKSKPDGYTLVMTSSATMAVAPAVYKDFNAHELTPVSILVDVPFGFFARTDLAVTDVKSLVALAKKDPGGIRVAVSSLGSHGHLTALMFGKATGTQFTIVPYKGTAPAMADLAGGHADLMVNDVSGMIPSFEGGQARALFVTTPTRLPRLPTVPTAKEQGQDFESSAWFGIAAPRGTPPEVLQFIQQAMAKGIAQNATERARLVDIGLTPVFDTPEEAMKRLRRDEATLGGLAASLNLPSN